MAAFECALEDFELFAAEITGESRDRPLRGAIEQVIRRFLKYCDERNWDEIQQLFNEEATLILSLEAAGFIYKGLDNIMEYYRSLDEQRAERTVIKHLLVDRGRVFLQINTWIMDNAEAEQEDETFWEVLRAMVIDLDANNKVRRVEFKLTNKEEIKYKGGPQMLNAMAEKDENEATIIRYA